METEVISQFGKRKHNDREFMDAAGWYTLMTNPEYQFLHNPFKLSTEFLFALLYLFCGIILIFLDYQYQLVSAILTGLALVFAFISPEAHSK